MALKGWDGTAWQEGPVRIWRDSMWTPAPAPQVWDGGTSAWVELQPVTDEVPFGGDGLARFTPGISAQYAGMRVEGLQRKLMASPRENPSQANIPVVLARMYRHSNASGTNPRGRYTFRLERESTSDFYIDMSTDVIPIIQDEWRTNACGIRLELYYDTVFWAVYDETGNSDWGSVVAAAGFLRHTTVVVELGETTCSAWFEGTPIFIDHVYSPARSPNFDVTLGLGEYFPNLHTYLVELNAQPLGTIDITTVDLPHGTPTPNAGSLRGLAEGKGIKTLIGTAAAAVPLAFDKDYGETLGREYNEMSIETANKMQYMQPQPGVFEFQESDFLFDYAEAHGMTIHGHALVWTEAMPDWIREEGVYTAQEIEDIMVNHVTTIVDRYKGRVRSWDVVNEPFVGFTADLRPDVWFENLGRGYIATALHAAHAADPGAMLFINEWGCEDAGTKRTALYDLCVELLDANVPLHGVGLQMHEDMNPEWGDGWLPENTPTVSKEMLKEAIQLFHSIGLKVRVSELDINMHDHDTGDHPGDLEAQGDWFGYYMEAALEEGIYSFCTWGFTDKHSSLHNWYTAGGYGNALPIDEFYDPKPAYTEMIGVLTNA